MFECVWRCRPDFLLRLFCVSLLSLPFFLREPSDLLSDWPAEEEDNVESAEGYIVQDKDENFSTASVSGLSYLT